MDFYDLKRKARESGLTFEIVCPYDTNYDAAREIANSRFDLLPCAIAYCETAADVSWCVDYCANSGTGLRVRSGGHHHEGMCSADEVLIIDLSKMNCIKFEHDMKTAWIPPGKHLEDVYAELEAKNRIIPGGGCGSVCVGGLTQGGGWGPSARKLGLTCDNIKTAEVVLANGKIVCASADNEYSDLFWAIRGGGGGNFGVITNFEFKLFRLEVPLTTFEIHWTKDHMLTVCKKWMKEFSGLDNNLTSFCRLLVVDQETLKKPSVLLGGQLFGDVCALTETLKPLFDVALPVYTKYESNEFPHQDSHYKSGAIDSVQSDFRASTRLAHRIMALGSMLQPAGPKAPAQTCDAPHPHKISSTFPKDGDYSLLAEEIVEFICSSEASENVNTYLSLHGMGGAITCVPEEGSAFPYRTKDFMLQFQAWWSDPTDPNTELYLDWVKNFREQLKPFTEGSFINFPDKFLVSDADTQRVELLEYYYGVNLPRLREIKTKYDPLDLFYFGMSIPPEN